MTTDVERELALLKQRGLTFADCIKAFAAEEHDPFVIAARERTNDDLEIDAHAVVSPSEDGAFVMGWIWITNEAAGVEGA